MRPFLQWYDGFIMDVDRVQFEERKERARALYTTHSSIFCPYFGAQVVLNSDGFHHLQFSARRERPKREQLLKLRLLPLALKVIQATGTLQEHRKTLAPVGKRSARDGSIPMKQVEHWAFVAIVGENPIRIRVITRRVGDGNIIFWSVMPDVKIKDGEQKLYSKNIDDED